MSLYYNENSALFTNTSSTFSEGKYFDPNDLRPGQSRKFDSDDLQAWLDKDGEAEEARRTL